MTAPGAERRVVVTGVGIVTPLGGDPRAVREAVARGEKAIHTASRFDAAGFAAADAAEVTEDDARRFFPTPKALKLCDSKTRFAVVAAARALESGGIAGGSAEAEPVGVVLGTSGCNLRADDLSRALSGDPTLRCLKEVPFFAERILAGLNPLWLLVTLPNMVSAHVSIQLGTLGPNSTVMTDWIAGIQAIGEAALWIRQGEADAVLAGGAETAVLPFAFGSLEEAGAFEGEPPGERFVPGEGAAVFLLEEEGRARRRGARVRAELCGYAVSCAGTTESDVESGIAVAMRGALEQSGWTASDLDAVCRAAVPLARARRAEDRALAQLLGGSAGRPAEEYRSALGHAFAAANPIDLALALDAMADAPARLLVNSIGYAGQAAALAFRAGA